MPRNLWDTVAGMHDEKRLLEERLDEGPVQS
jgi:hypothetical protein